MRHWRAVAGVLVGSKPIVQLEKSLHRPVYDPIHMES